MIDGIPVRKKRKNVSLFGEVTYESVEPVEVKEYDPRTACSRDEHLRRNNFHYARHLSKEREHRASTARWFRGIHYPYDLGAHGFPHLSGLDSQEPPSKSVMPVRHCADKHTADVVAADDDNHDRGDTDSGGEDV